MKLPIKYTPPNGEFKTQANSEEICLENISVETFGGRLHVEWEPQSPVTALGQLVFFIEFLKLGNLFDPWVEDCPLSYSSPNAPTKREILGTLMLSVLAGNTRYAHITALRCDGINPGLLGMEKIASEDSVRRAFKRMDETEGLVWQQKHLDKCTALLLSVPWIMDIDTTVKPLYGHQEGAVVGYNPTKPGRPSHTIHTYLVANLRLILDSEVQAGNHNAARYSAPELWALLDRIPKAHWPTLIRGDCAFGIDPILQEAEARKVPYLFKLKLTANVKRLIEKLMLGSQWERAGQGWEAVCTEIQLSGWQVKRQIVVLRKAVRKESLVAVKKGLLGQSSIAFAEVDKNVCAYEYAVLVTSVKESALTIAQHYRDRADSENVFDELKNQWGWGGFTTHDLKRCRLMARLVALVYNWWNLFTRLAEPDKHLEAITSRPLLLHAVAKQTKHGGQQFIHISSSHGKQHLLRQLLQRITEFFKSLKASAEQFTDETCWRRILSKAFEKYLPLGLPIMDLIPNTS